MSAHRHTIFAKNINNVTYRYMKYEIYFVFRYVFHLVIVKFSM